MKDVTLGLPWLIINLWEAMVLAKVINAPYVIFKDIKK